MVIDRWFVVLSALVVTYLTYLGNMQVEDVCCCSAFDPLSETEHSWAAWCEESATVERSE